MLQTSAAFLICLVILNRVIAGPASVQAGAFPTVALDNATVTGFTFGTTNHFLGIPYAQPPTGNLRFQLPQTLPPYNSSFAATLYGPTCPQQAPSLSLLGGLTDEILHYLTTALWTAVTPSAEDCLTLNVIAPTNATPTSNLPVVVWIFGGGFELGGTSPYDGSVIVNKALSLSVPAIYVSMNYRLNAFGFLGGQEVKDAGIGNLGLQDQRLALKWIQKYIGAFGGDPTKVTIWGESAGAMSVGLHMVTNGGNTEGLFRAAFMQSGSPIPVGDITVGQKYYDALVADTGCSGATDTLQCLREVPYQKLMDAVNNSPGLFAYQSVNLAWLPRVDGVFLKAAPQELVRQGSVANIPFINGDCDDEGPTFSLSSRNITTDAEFEEYLSTYFVSNASMVAQLMTYYPSNLIQGSPFNTGQLNGLTAQFKRLAAYQGDAVFQAPRRFFLQSRSGKQNIWTYLSTRSKVAPFLGSYHGSDLLNVYGGLDLASYLVRFVTNLDPNVGQSRDLYWPQYNTETKQMLEFSDGLVTQSLINDTYRAEAMAYLTNVMFEYPLT